MSIPFKFITAASSYSLCLLISISKGTTLVTSLFFVSSALNTLNEKLISFVWILLFFTSCLLISICMHPKLTNALTLRFFLFFVLIFACTFNFFSELLLQLGIIYFSWKFTEISCIIPTWDLHQNPSSYHLLCHLHYLILSEPFISSLTAFLYNPSLCALLCHIWNISLFPFLSSSNIL